MNKLSTNKIINFKYNTTNMMTNNNDNEITNIQINNNSNSDNNSDNNNSNNDNDNNINNDSNNNINNDSDNNINNTENITFDKDYSLWYHNPNDTNWTEDSYHQMITFNTSNEFWILNHLIDNFMIENGMFFIMKENVVPIWENDDNINGGYLSWKIEKNKVHNNWIDLIGHLLLDNIIDGDNSIVNGCSISPKKNFNILKIWTNCEINTEEIKLNNTLKLSNYNFAFKLHKINIEKDKKQKNKLN